MKRSGSKHWILFASRREQSREVDDRADALSSDETLKRDRVSYIERQEWSLCLQERWRIPKISSDDTLVAEKRSEVRQQLLADLPASASEKDAAATCARGQEAPSCEQPGSEPSPSCKKH